MKGDVSWKKIDGNTFDTLTNSYWTKFTLKNTSEFDNEWVIDFGNWAVVSLYRVRDSLPPGEPDRSGKLVPYNDRPFKALNYVQFNERLRAGESITYLAKLEVGALKLYTNPSSVISYGPRPALEEATASRSKWINVFLFIFLFATIYHLFIYFFTVRKRYIFYLGIILTHAYLTSSNSGLLVEQLSFLPWFVNIHEPLAGSIAGVSGMFLFLFIRDIFNTRKHIPKWDKFMVYWIGFHVVAAILYFINDEIFGFLGLMLIIFNPIIIMIVSIRSVLKKVPSAGYVLVAYSSTLVAIVVFTYTVVGILPETEFALNYIVPTSFTIDILLYSIALANAIKVLTVENQEQQDEIIKQLKENDALQTKVNRELEDKIRERTKAIKLQNELLEEEKHRSDSLLLNILPESTAEELKNTGKAKPRQYDLVTVLFTDFSGFTSISEKLQPEELVENLDQCFKVFDEITLKYGLEKIKTIGDAYMCAGGIPEVDPDHPVKVVNAALEMRAFIESWNEEKRGKGELPWTMRIGIYSGHVTAGVVGKNKFAYDIWGDAVNVAARMESSGVPQKVNVSSETWALVKGHFQGEPRGKIDVKNKGPIEMFFVESLEMELGVKDKADS